MHLQKRDGNVSPDCQRCCKLLKEASTTITTRFFDFDETIIILFVADFKTSQLLFSGWVTVSSAWCKWERLDSRPLACYPRPNPAVESSGSCCAFKTNCCLDIQSYLERKENICASNNPKALKTGSLQWLSSCTFANCSLSIEATIFIQHL